MQASEVLQLVRFPTMDQQELCEAAKHPVVVGDPKVQVRTLLPQDKSQPALISLLKRHSCMVPLPSAAKFHERRS